MLVVDHSECYCVTNKKFESWFSRKNVSEYQLDIVNLSQDSKALCQFAQETFLTIEPHVWACNLFKKTPTFSKFYPLHNLLCPTWPCSGSWASAALCVLAGQLLSYINFAGFPLSFWTLTTLYNCLFFWGYSRPLHWGKRCTYFFLQWERHFGQRSGSPQGLPPQLFQDLLEQCRFIKKFLFGE